MSQETTICPYCDHKVMHRSGGIWCKWCRFYLVTYVTPRGDVKLMRFAAAIGYH